MQGWIVRFGVPSTITTDRSPPPCGCNWPTSLESSGFILRPTTWLLTGWLSAYIVSSKPPWKPTQHLSVGWPHFPWCYLRCVLHSRRISTARWYMVLRSASLENFLLPHAIPLTNPVTFPNWNRPCNNYTPLPPAHPNDPLMWAQHCLHAPMFLYTMAPPADPCSSHTMDPTKWSSVRTNTLSLTSRVVMRLSLLTGWNQLTWSSLYQPLAVQLHLLAVHSWISQTQGPHPLEVRPLSHGLDTMHVHWPQHLQDFVP